MEVASATTQENEIQRTWLTVSMTRSLTGKLYVSYPVEHTDVVQANDLPQKLSAADDGQDTYLHGVIKGGNYFATSVQEGEPGNVAFLSAHEFILFCEALSIPYIDPAM